MRILGVLVALGVAHFLSRWAQHGLVRSLERRKFDVTLTQFFGKVARYAILGSAIISCLGVVGFETASFAAAIAAFGLAIGLALQGALANFVAGVMLLLLRPFKVGDVITVSGVTGVVDELLLFSTNLRTADNRKLVLPNNAVFGQVLENSDHYPTRRVDVPVSVRYGADLAETRRALELVPEMVPDALKEPAPQIFLDKLGSVCVDWEVRVWCETSKGGNVQEQVVQAIVKVLGRRGSIPQMDLHFDEEVTAALAGKWHRSSELATSLLRQPSDCDRAKVGLGDEARLPAKTLGQST